MGADARDAERVRRYLETGDLRWFDELVASYRNRVMRLVLSVLGPELANDAEDVVQEVFVRAHRHLGRFSGRSSFGTWITSIAIRLCLDLERSRKRRPPTRNRATKGRLTRGAGVPNETAATCR